MNVKGFIIEDNQGREFVLLCEQPFGQSGKTFLLRGWQRLRLVPLQYTEWELRQIVGGVLIALHDLFKSLPRFSNNAEALFCGNKSTATSRLKKTPVLRRINGEEG